MTGIVSAILTAFGVALMVLSPMAALAIVDASMAVAVGAGMGTVGLAGVTWLYLRRRFRPRRRSRYPRPGSPRHRLRLLPPWEWQPAIAQIRGEAREMRPRWTDEDRKWLEENRASLPQARGRRR